MTDQTELGAARLVLDASVATIGGQARPGQIDMATAVQQALDTGTHLLVQAGTGTGKSFGYLAPALVWAVETGQTVVVATATLALQAQLANKDIPVTLDAVEKVTGQRPVTAIVKGRGNYACLLRVLDGVGLEQDALLGGADVAKAARKSGASAESLLGAEVVALREWVDSEARRGGLADRDDAPRHSPKAWAQVAVGVRECVGAQKCPYAKECFVEESRHRASRADLIVTNHALLAVDAMQGHSVLPEHAAVIIDEAHELVDRVTGAASQELSPQSVERVARRALGYLNDDLGMALLDSVDALREGLDASEIGRLTNEEAPVLDALRQVSGAARDAIAKLKGGDDLEQTQAQAAVQEVFDIADRMADLRDDDVLWVSEREHFGRQMVVAPLDVVDLLRDKVFQDATCVLTSATLTIGGSFGPLASRMGFWAADERTDGRPPSPDVLEQAHEWRGLDVGSPFDYRTQGICYVARHMPNPGRDGIGPDQLAEVAELVWAAGGRTLGLFASQRNAEAAAAYVRREVPDVTVLCQGDAQLPELTRQFVDEPATCLFGTLSLWQGVDVPGETCLLVVIDKIPFPRPDDPLMQARQAAVAASGGNGFMAVAATQAGLLLAQGAGRLIRRLSDRGVVAVLDPRLVTARYGSFLRASMPNFWQTTDREVAIDALRRLAGNVKADA